MARIFITGSADGLGQMAAKELVRQGHEVVLHARSAARARQALEKVPGAGKVLIGDLSSMDETRKLAEEVNALGFFDVVIHNAGVYQVSNQVTFAVNSLAPYILTALIEKPERLIYLSSGMHRQGRPSLDHVSIAKGVNYSDSKLHVLLLAKAVAHKWPQVYSNAVDPGWVPTKMGGAGAPDSFEKGIETQVWLAVSKDKEAMVSGRYFHHKREARYLQATDDVMLQERFVELCAEVTQIHFPVSID